MLKVDEWRRAKNVTKKDMANLLGITVPTYDKFERNPSKMSDGMAKKVAEILEVDYSDINFFAEQ